MKKMKLTAGILCLIAMSAQAALVIDYTQATANTDATGALTYGIDGSGNLTGNSLANNAEVLSGNTPFLSSVGTLMTLNAWDLNSVAPSVVASNTAADFLEANVSGSGWSTSGLINSGFRIKTGTGAGTVPGTGANTWQQGSEFMILEIAAPAGSYASMDITFQGTSAIKAYQAGDADPNDGVGPGTFSASLTPGQSLDLLLWNRESGGAKRLWGITVDVIPEPATIGLFAICGGGLLIIRRRSMRR